MEQHNREVSESGMACYANDAFLATFFLQIGYIHYTTAKLELEIVSYVIAQIKSWYTQKFMFG